MLPGNINPRQLKHMMRRMGIKTEEINAESVVIHGAEKDIIIENPQVIKTIMQGQEIFQVSGGEIREEEKGEEEEKETEAPSINEEDVKVVMEQANVSEEEALEALEKTKGDIAEAIINLKS
jgi:nascent polypeptide-associated complex subunit alpha